MSLDARAVRYETILVSTTYIPVLLCPDLLGHDLAAGSLYRLLDQDYGLKIARGEWSLKAVARGPGKHVSLMSRSPVPFYVWTALPTVRMTRPLSIHRRCTVATAPVSRSSFTLVLRRTNAMRG